MWVACSHVDRMSNLTVSLWSESAGRGAAVMCIQGVGVAGSGWEPQVRPLAERFQVITFDNRGVGRTPRGDGPLSIELMAADVWAILDANGVDRCHLVGHSMGGLIALEAALMARERVQSLSLLCTFPHGSAATQISLRMAILGLRSRVGTRAMRRQGMLRMIFPADWLRAVDRVALAERLAILFGRDLGDSPPIISEQLRAMSAYDARDRLKELRGIPTLVMSGLHDPIAPPVFGRMLAAGIEGARYVEFGEASHALPIQCADRVTDLLVEHLTGAASASAR